MRVLLVRPFIPPRLTYNVIPPIGLGYLASAVRTGGHDVEILDCVKDQLDLDDFLREAASRTPDVIGFTLFSHDLPWSQRAVAATKKAMPHVITLLGGPHVAGMGERIFAQAPETDFAFTGESESGFVELLDLLQGSGGAPEPSDLEPIPGLIHRVDGEAVLNKAYRPLDLDEIEFPAWDMIDPRTYPEAPQGAFFRRLPVAPMVFTRGCPYPCTFCAASTTLGKALRKRSIHNIMAEIELLMGQYGIREIHVLDDNFTFDNRYVERFCETLLQKGVDITWGCPNGVRLDTLTPGLVRLMKRSGCYYLSVGIETGSQRMLDIMRKGLTIELIREQVAMVREAGLEVNGFFILGNPGETEADIHKTIRFAKELDLGRALFSNYLPLPGTPAYRELEESGELGEPDWGSYYQSQTPYAPKNLTKERLKELSRRAYRSFYLRPTPIFRLLSNIRTAGQVRFILRRAAAFM